MYRSTISVKEAEEKAASLCSRREYCRKEMFEKAISWGCLPTEAQEVVDFLLKHGFIDDRRYAESYVKDKWRFNKWGRIKLTYMLRGQGIGEEDIRAGLSVIGEDAYAELLTDELKKKRKSIQSNNEAEIKGKLFRFASGRGFEPDIIAEIIRKLIFLCFLFGMCSATSLVSCSGSGQQSSATTGTISFDSTTIEYARGFTAEKRGDITLLTVSNPWQGAQNVMFRYVLCPKGTKVPDEYVRYTVIYTPVERVICMATTHVAMLSAIGKTSSIKAMSGSAYISDPEVRQAVTDGQIADIGYDRGLNYEKIISLNPDVIFAYGVGGEAVGSMTRLTDLGQKVVFNAEYLERTALGKAEWMKFMAAFYQCEDTAFRRFETVKNEYLSLCKTAKNETTRPAVLCGLPWQGTWYVPGGETTVAAMIADAGGDFLWKDNRSHESIPINIETIVNKGRDADLWIDTGAARSLGEIAAVDERLALIKPFRTGMIYNNYARSGAGGGNDFFESGVVNPHIILKDMIRIFHPDLLPDHELYYYMKLGKDSVQREKNHR